LLAPAIAAAVSVLVGLLTTLDSLGKAMLTTARRCGECDGPVESVPSPTGLDFLAVLNIPNSPAVHPGVLTCIVASLLLVGVVDIVYLWVLVQQTILFNSIG